MDKAYEVSDSTDWKDTSLPQFALVDAALRCQVCKDFFTTAVITSCAHTFCSLCIRRCLAADGKCPTCRANEQEVKLRKNVAVQEVTDAFIAARPQALELATRSTPTEASDTTTVNGLSRGTKRRRNTEIGDERPAPRRSQRRKASSQQSASQEATAVDDEARDGDFAPEEGNIAEDGLVACPICGKRMKDELVFSHLDRCEGDTTANNNTKPSQTRSKPTISTRPQTSARPPPERLPAINYSLYKEAALRKKLGELGISTLGSKLLLIKRHLEWVALWNANCDSARPRSKGELKANLDQWERTQGGLAPSGTQGNAVMNKDFDGVGWVRKNKGDFDQLIESARRKMAGSRRADVPQAKDGESNSTSEYNGASARDDLQEEVMANASADDDALPSIPSKYFGINSPAESSLDKQDVDASAASDALPKSPTRPPEPEDRHSHQSEALPSSLVPNPSQHPVRKKPMFTVPAEPVVDADIGEMR